MLRRLAWLLVALGIASCRTLPPPAPEMPEWAARRAELQQRTAFELKGRVAVAVGNDGFNARLRWVQQGGLTHLSLDGPLGAGGLQVTVDGEHISIVTSRGEHLDDDAARAELAARLGFEPPLGQLHYWILGVPRPGEVAQESLDSHQRLATLLQDDWQIQYSDYMTVRGEWLPSRLTLQRAGIRVRVIVDGWDS
jgi:outer membrane lipoprotein LolB